MSEMVERVARAIFDTWENSPLGTRDPAVTWRRAIGDRLMVAEVVVCRQMARAALAAMREPTIPMIVRGDAEYDLTGVCAVGEIWKVMIDEALK